MIDLRYLVTGGSGFVGRQVVLHLLEKGNFVRIIDNNFRGTFQNFKSTSQLELVQGDIRDLDLTTKVGENIDEVIHLAFINGTKYFYQNPSLVTEVGMRGMLNILDSAKINKIKRFTLFSSSEVYQTPNKIPTPEMVPLVIPDISNPRYSYGGTKIANELMLEHIGATFLDSRKVIRPHNIYGLDMEPDHVIPALIEKILKDNDYVEIQGDGYQTRSFCNIKDFLQAFDLVLKSDSPNETFNIGTKDEISILDLAKLIMKLMSKDKEILFLKSNVGETRRRCPDISKIQRLGYVPSVTLEAGLLELIATGMNDLNKNKDIF